MDHALREPTRPSRPIIAAYDISAALLVHVPEGMSQKYLIRRVRMSGRGDHHHRASEDWQDRNGTVECEGARGRHG
jgi:hypothetical protein